MAFPKFKSIVDECITLMGQVAGSGVQTYSQPLVEIAVNRMFDYIWNKRKWEHLWSWEAGTIGLDGTLTADLTGVRTYMDVDTIRDAQSHQIIPISSDTKHLYVTGGRPLYRTVLPWTDPRAENRMFKFWPIGNTTDVEIFIGHRPEEFAGDDDVVPMDRTLMVFGVVWFMLADDGTNPASADKFQGLFDLTYQAIVSKLGATEIGHGGGRNGQTVYIR